MAFSRPSERRAKAVQKQLEKLGIPAGEIVVHWKGKEASRWSKPVTG